MSKKDAAKLLGLTLDEYDSVLYQTAHQWGITKERERIIKLLEPLFDKAENAETRRLLMTGLAFIKGETE